MLGRSSAKTPPAMDEKVNCMIAPECEAGPSGVTTCKCETQPSNIAVNKSTD